MSNANLYHPSLVVFRETEYFTTSEPIFLISNNIFGREDSRLYKYHLSEAGLNSRIRNTQRRVNRLIARRFGTKKIDVLCLSFYSPRRPFIGGYLHRPFGRAGKRKRQGEISGNTGFRAIITRREPRKPRIQSRRFRLGRSCTDVVLMNLFYPFSISAPSFLFPPPFLIFLSSSSPSRLLHLFINSAENNREC